MRKQETLFLLTFIEGSGGWRRDTVTGSDRLRVLRLLQSIARQRGVDKLHGARWGGRRDAQLRVEHVGVSDGHHDATLWLLAASAHRLMGATALLRRRTQAVDWTAVRADMYAHRCTHAARREKEEGAIMAAL